MAKSKDMKGALNLPIVKREFLLEIRQRLMTNLPRKRLWLSAYASDKPLVAHTRAMNAARRVAIAHDSDFLKTAVSISA